MDLAEATMPLSLPNYTDYQDDNKAKAWGKLISQRQDIPSFDLCQDEVTVGRGKDCDLVLSNPGVSGLHCKLWREKVAAGGGGPMVWVQDLSTNGTFINDERMGKNTKKILLNTANLHLLFKGKGDDQNISFIFKDLTKDKEEGDPGGPEGKYYIGEALGSGNFAVVKLCIHKDTGASYALKIIDKKKMSMNPGGTKRPDALMDEVKILQALQHPGIIGIHEVFDTENTLYLVLELVTGGELFDKIVDEGKFTEEKTRHYFTQMLEATAYLHGQDIAHRDLKPENILMKDKTSDLLKISDFGLSRCVGEAAFMKTICGTPQYVAPEILTSSSTGTGYGVACDIWSLGVILYIMLCGHSPWNEEKKKSIFVQIKEADFEFEPEEWDDISESAKDLIKKLLTVDPAERMTVTQALVDPWVVGEKGDSAKRKREEEVPKGKKGPAKKRK